MATPSFASTLDQIRNATYELYFDGTPICSGQFVTPKVFVTASHCVTIPLEGPNDKPTNHKWSVRTSDGSGVKDFPLDFTLLENITYDVASFKLHDMEASFPFVDVAPKEFIPQLGETVYGAHYPLALEHFMLTEGTMVGVEDTFPQMIGKKSFVASLSTTSGSSGSGLYAVVDGTWKLIGTLEGGPPQAQYMSLYSPVAGIYEVTGL